MKSRAAGESSQGLLSALLLEGEHYRYVRSDAVLAGQRELIIREAAFREEQDHLTEVRCCADQTVLLEIPQHLLLEIIITGGHSQGQGPARLFDGLHFLSIHRDNGAELMQ